MTIEMFPCLSDLKFEGALLVVPAVAYANVGELAIDALITTLNLTRVSYLESPHILPVIGNDPYTLTHPGTLATPLELFHSQSTDSDSNNVFFLQQRAPAIAGCQAAFSTELATWAKHCGFARVLVLCALDAGLRRDAQLLSGQLQLPQGPLDYATKPGGGAVGTMVWCSESAETTRVASALAVSPVDEGIVKEDREVHSLLQPWPLLAALEAQSLLVVLMTRFASEGDNSMDATALAVDVLRFLTCPDLVSKPLVLEGLVSGVVVSEHMQILRPCSWVAMYGAMSDWTRF